MLSASVSSEATCPPTAPSVYSNCSGNHPVPPHRRGFYPLRQAPEPHQPAWDQKQRCRLRRMAPHRADSPRRRVGDRIQPQVGFGRPHFCQCFSSDLIWPGVFLERIVLPPSCARSLRVWGTRERWLHVFGRRQSSHLGPHVWISEHFLPLVFLFVTHPERFLVAMSLISPLSQTTNMYPG